MKCNNCGANINDGEQFCWSCGNPVGTPNTQSSDNYGYTTGGGNAGNSAPYGGNAPYGNTPAPAGNTSGNNQKMIIIIAVIAAVMILAICTVVRVTMLQAQKLTPADNSTVTEETNTVTDDLPMPTAIPQPYFTMANASSIRGTDTEGGEYSVNAVLTPDPMTKWVPNKGSSGGINEWIEISAGTIQYVNGIEILNGYHKSPEVWRNNNRVSRCTITFSNGESMQCVLDDTMDFIRIDFGRMIETTSIRLTINDIYRGVKWDDTAITYLGAY